MTSSDDSPDGPDRAFPIVGIGASAGGLEAFKNFLQALPADSGLAFVLTQHLDPTHESMMADLLAKHTAMPVLQAEDGMSVRPDHVYMIPPNRYLHIRDRRLQLTEPRERRGPRVVIDTFLRSLAKDQQERAVGIVLTGTGSDGAAGIREIKAQGGLTLAQEPATAAHDSMPRAAIGTDAVDIVCPIEEMPAALAQYARHPYVNGHGSGVPMAADNQDSLESVLELLRRYYKTDFRHYKRPTLIRRIQRRLGLNQLHDLDDYLDFLSQHPDEVERLGKDLMIGVTGFFRDSGAFDVLAEQVIRPLVAGAEGDQTIRVWSPGCATGEEPYSIAMLLFDAMAAEGKKLPVQIFGSDLDGAALEVARAGRYPVGIAADIAPERLQRYFHKSGDEHFLVNQELRDTVVFARHNLIHDPPFSKLDLVSCRNLLIYLQPAIQEQLIRLFHFALRPDGHLFLGNAESVGAHQGLFSAGAKKWRLYRRVDTSAGRSLEFPLQPVDDRRKAPEASATRRRPQLSDMAQRWIVEEFAPVAVLVNHQFDSLYFSGAVEHYLNLPRGEPNLNLLDLLREGLVTRVRGAIQKCLDSNEPITLERVRMRHHDQHRIVNVQIRPLRNRSGGEGMALVAFSDAPSPAPAPALTAERDAASGGDEQLIRQLEDELKNTREDLQTTIEEMETSNEELKASNEEVMSTNEELQSTNEELETSKEELQSLNEELNTVNQQLQDKIGELEQANNDITNLLNSADVATLFLDTRLRIKRFTPTATTLFNLIDGDVGRPLSDLSWKFADERLLSDARGVLERLVPMEQEVEDAGGRWFLRRINPYRTQDNRIDGVVVTFAEVTELRNSKQLAEERLAQLEALYRDSPVALAFLDRDLRMVRLSERLAAINGKPLEQQLGLTPRAFLPGPLGEEIEAILRGVLESGEPRIEVEFRSALNATDGILRDWSASYFPVCDSHGAVMGINAVVQDITESRQRERRLALERAVARIQLENLSPEPAIVRVMDAFAEYLDALICEYWTSGDDGRLYCRQFQVPSEPTRQESLKAHFNNVVFPPGKSLVGWVWSEQRSRWVGDVRRDTHFERSDEARELDLQTGFALPVVHAGESLGVLSFFSRERLPREGELLEALTGIGRQLGAGIQQWHTEQTLQQTRQHLQLALEIGGIGIWRRRLPGSPMELDGRCQALFGLDDGASVEAFLAVVDAADRDTLRQQLEAITDPTGPHSFALEPRLRRADGVTRWVSLLGFCQFGGDAAERRPEWMIGVVQDITESRETTRLLQENDQRKNEFLSVLGHELRNPLGALSNGLELLRLDAGDREGVIRLIGNGVETMARLLDDLLDLSRINRGLIELRIQQVALTPFLERCVQSLESRFHERDQQLELRAAPDVIHVQADPLRLEQIVCNLLVNASKFSDPGERVVLESRREGDVGVIVVSDPGMGLPPEGQTRIFEPFEKLQRENLDNSGLGIGLALVKQLVELHDGSVTVHSDGPGQGTCFTVRVPLAEAPEAAETAQQTDPAAVPAGLRVLVVDDNPANLQGLSLLLKVWGCEVATAGNGEGALAMVGCFCPTAIVLDLGLPDISGYEVARRLRRDGFDGLLLALSGYGGAQVRERAAGAGFDRHLTKPAEPEQLRRLLADLDDRRALGAN